MSQHCLWSIYLHCHFYFFILPTLLRKYLYSKLCKILVCSYQRHEILQRKPPVEFHECQEKQYADVHKIKIFNFD